MGVSPSGLSGQSLTPRVHPTLQPEAGQSGGKKAAPVPGIGHLHDDEGGLKLGCDIGPRVGPIQQGPWPWRAKLWEAGDWPCCGIIGAETDGPEMESWAMCQEGRVLEGLGRDSQVWWCLQGSDDYSGDC